MKFLTGFVLGWAASMLIGGATSLPTDNKTATCSSKGAWATGKKWSCTPEEAAAQIKAKP